MLRKPAGFKNIFMRQNFIFSCREKQDAGQEATLAVGGNVAGAAQKWHLRRRRCFRTLGRTPDSGRQANLGKRVCVHEGMGL